MYCVVNRISEVYWAIIDGICIIRAGDELECLMKISRGLSAWLWAGVVLARNLSDNNEQQSLHWILSILFWFVSFLNISESIRELIGDVGTANINISSVQHYRPGSPPSPGLELTWASPGQDQPAAQPCEEAHLTRSESFRLRGCSSAAVQQGTRLTRQIYITLLYLQPAAGVSSRKLY